MKIYKKLCDILYNITGVIDILLIICIIAFTFLQVISRYIISFSIPWAQELCIYSLVWLVLLGCSMGMRKHEVASLSLVLNLFPQKSRQIISILNDIILSVFLGYIISANKGVIANAMKRTSGMMHIKMGYVNLALTVSSVLIIIYCVEDIFNRISILKNGEVKQET